MSTFVKGKTLHFNLLIFFSNLETSQTVKVVSMQHIHINNTVVLFQLKYCKLVFFFHVINGKSLEQYFYCNYSNSVGKFLEKVFLNLNHNKS